MNEIVDCDAETKLIIEDIKRYKAQKNNLTKELKSLTNEREN